LQAQMAVFQRFFNVRGHMQWPKRRFE